MIRILILLLIAAQPAAARDWTAEKCERYDRAWDAAVQQRGLTGLSPEFVAAHAAFIASGCRQRAACPRRPEELAMADLMTILAVNVGISGTFLPFMCRP